MPKKLLSAAAGLAFIAGASLVAAPSAMASTTEAGAAPTLDVVGYSIVDGLPDTKNPLDSSTITNDVGFSSVNAGFDGEESVIGVDERKRVEDTTAAPYSAVVKLGGGRLSGCTGWMISADTLVTAGHCVWEDNQFTTDFSAWPAKDGSKTPFGECNASEVWMDRRFRKTGEAGTDWAVVKLNCDVGKETGTFGYKVESDANILDSNVTVTGYPGDKPSGTMWTHGKETTKVTDREIWYRADTIGGQSGAPVYNGASQAVAIHTNGNIDTADTSDGNRGPRIHQNLFNTLTNVKNR